MRVVGGGAGSLNLSGLIAPQPGRPAIMALNSSTGPMGAVSPSRQAALTSVVNTEIPNEAKTFICTCANDKEAVQKALW